MVNYVKHFRNLQIQKFCEKNFLSGFLQLFQNWLGIVYQEKVPINNLMVPLFKFHIQMMLIKLLLDRFNFILNLYMHNLIEIWGSEEFVPFQNTDSNRNLLIFAQQFLHLLTEITLHNFKIISQVDLK